jgi:hypothetical protein
MRRIVTARALLMQGHMEEPVTHRSRTFALLAACLVALCFPGCGGGPPTGLGDDFSVISEGSQSNIPPLQTSGGAAYFVVVRTNVAGTLEGTVDWTLASNPVAIFWGRGDCTQNPNCETLSQNIGATKPKSVSVVNASPGLYSLMIANLGTSNESVSFRVTLRP